MVFFFTFWFPVRCGWGLERSTLLEHEMLFVKAEHLGINISIGFHGAVRRGWELTVCGHFL